jgi:hypothetical protein
MYDTNCGPTEEQTLYIRENNSTDYMHIVDEKGKEVECRGTDSYCNMLAHALMLEDYDSPGESCKIEEIGFGKLPENIQKILK